MPPPAEPERTEARAGGAEFASFRELSGGLPHSALGELESELQRVHLTSGETLVRQGEPGDCMYLLLTGRLRAYVRGADGSEVVAGEVGRGEVVGEMALLIDEPRSATVRAVRDSELLRLSKEAFDRVSEKHPVLMRQIARVNLTRLRRSMLLPRAGSTVATIAVVPAGREAPLAEFARSLAVALDAIGPTLHLDQGKVGRQREGSLAAWLGEQELKYRFVLYESDRTASAWTRRSLRQADHVLAVGVAGSDPALGEAEAEIEALAREGPAARKHLVLLHADASGRPRGTQAWLAPRHVDGHHHVRMHSRADYDRLARLLSGRAVGLVLGGGGSRGMAQIGAIRAIQERAIPIDFVGGSSSGALVAGMLAKGMDCESMLRAVEAAARGPVLDLTLPFVSLISGRRISRVLERGFEDVRIEDLPLGYFCVSTNLSRGRMVVHRTGPLWKGIRASVSIPGILPPLVEDGDLLVDGGLLNNLPVDVMRGLSNGGPVLAISVRAQGALAAGKGSREHLSGWRMLAGRLNPFAPRGEGPSIAGILMSSTLVGSALAQEGQEQAADLCVRLTPEPRGLMDFKSLAAMVDAGYEAASAQLDEWLASGGATAALDSTPSPPRPRTNP